MLSRSFGDKTRKSVWRFFAFVCLALWLVHFLHYVASCLH